MGGEGAMVAANASLKNNRSLLAKRKEKKALSGSYANVDMKEFPNATPRRLNEIREKLTRENREIRIKQFTAIILLMLILLSVFFYYY